MCGNDYGLQMFRYSLSANSKILYATNPVSLQQVQSKESNPLRYRLANAARAMVSNATGNMICRVWGIAYLNVESAKFQLHISFHYSKDDVVTALIHDWHQHELS